MKQDFKAFDYNDSSKFKKEAHWLLPQTLAMIARETKLVINEASEQYDGLASMKANLNLAGLGSEQTMAIYRYITIEPRSAIITKAEDFPEYCALVPLYLYAFKKYKGIPYSAWDRECLEFVVDSELLSAITAIIPESVTTEQLIEYRTYYTFNSLTPEKAWSIKTTKDKEFNVLPRLTKIMLCQTWVAHPSRRNEYMVLTTHDWDIMPEPLVSTNVSAEDSNPWLVDTVKIPRTAEVPVESTNLWGGSTTSKRTYVKPFAAYGT